MPTGVVLRLFEAGLGHAHQGAAAFGAHDDFERHRPDRIACVIEGVLVLQVVGGFDGEALRHHVAFADVAPTENLETLRVEVRVEARLHLVARVIELAPIGEHVTEVVTAAGWAPPRFEKLDMDLDIAAG